MTDSMTRAFTTDDIVVAVELPGVYDGTSVYLLKDGSVVNRWDGTGIARRWEATDRWITEHAAALRADWASELDCLTATSLHDHLNGQHFTYATEDGLQAGIAASLAAAGHAVHREVRLGARDRIDLLVSGVGIEVKIAGTADRLLAQLARYAAHPQIRELLVVTTRSQHRAIPATIGGKPCRVLHIGGIR